MREGLTEALDAHRDKEALVGPAQIGLENSGPLDLLQASALKGVTLKHPHSFWPVNFCMKPVFLWVTCCPGTQEPPLVVQVEAVALGRPRSWGLRTSEPHNPVSAWILPWGDLALTWGHSRYLAPHCRRRTCLVSWVVPVSAH